MTVEVIVAFITGILGPIIVVLTKNYLDKRRNNKKDLVRETLRISELVNNKLETIKENTKADRVWVTQFHNGGNFYPTGKSMTKFSVIYEIVGPSINSIQSNFQNIPVNLFSKSINFLLENDFISIPDYKDEKIATHGLKYIAEDTGCKSGYLFSIKTIDDKFVGVLGLDYVKKKVNLSDDDIKHLMIESSSIGGVLNP
jgi:hypothetical protein